MDILWDPSRVPWVCFPKAPTENASLHYYEVLGSVTDTSVWNLDPKLAYLTTGVSSVPSQVIPLTVMELVVWVNVKVRFSPSVYEQSTLVGGDLRACGGDKGLTEVSQITSSEVQICLSRESVLRKVVMMMTNAMCRIPPAVSSSLHAETFQKRVSELAFLLLPKF